MATARSPVRSLSTTVYAYRPCCVPSHEIGYITADPLTFLIGGSPIARCAQKYVTCKAPDVSATLAVYLRGTLPRVTFAGDSFEIDGRVNLSFQICKPSPIPVCIFGDATSYRKT